MVCAEKKWNKRRLTEESLLHLDAHGPGCKVEVVFKDQKESQEEETQGTPEQRQECATGMCSEIIQARGVI